MIVISWFILVSTLIQTASGQSLKLKAYQTTWIPLPPDKATYSWDDIDVSVVLDIETNKVYINAKPQQVFILLKLRKKFIDENNDKFSVYAGKDEKGTECKLSIKELSAKTRNHTVDLSIDYFDKEIIYRLRPL